MLNCNCRYVLHGLQMTHCNTDFTLIFFSSFGTYLLDQLAADGACLTGGQVAVVAVGQVDADFLCSLHLETVHGLTSLGNVQLVVVELLIVNLSFCFLRMKILSEESIFCSVVLV